MEQDFYIKLTLAVYQVTELFPQSEPLRLQTRELANKILADLLINQGEKSSRPIQDLKNLFDLAESQNWVDSRNFLVLCREYDKIEKFCVENMGKTVPARNASPARQPDGSLGGGHSDAGGEKPLTTQKRKQEILRVLQEKKRIKAKELTKDFPQISKRTIIRDLEELYQAGVVVRVGNARASCYNIKS